MIAYFHQYPTGDGIKIDAKVFHEPMPMDCSNCGYYSDRIYNMHGATKRFYVATFGYTKAWKEQNLYERIIDRYQVHFVFEGKGTFNGKPVSAGQMFIAPQNKPHTIVQDPDDPMTFAWFAFSGTELENQLSLLHLPDDFTIMPYPNMQQIKEIFVDTVYGPYSSLDLEMFVLSACYKVLALCNISNRETESAEATHEYQYFSEIVSYINSHYFKKISVADIANHVHISPSYLYRICTQISQKSPQDLINDKRISVAKSFLANNTTSIGEISLFLGFSNPNSFSNFFKKHCGISAQEYRQQEWEKRKQKEENIIRTEASWRKDEELRIAMLSDKKRKRKKPKASETNLL